MAEIRFPVPQPSAPLPEINEDRGPDDDAEHEDRAKARLDRRAKLRSAMLIETIFEEDDDD